MDLKINANFQLDVAQLTLKEAHELLFSFPKPKIPFVIWLLENPHSPLALPGKVSLIAHDYIHILLGQGLSPQEEAFVIGFTMGNDLKTNTLHLLIYKFFASFIYPTGLKFSKIDCFYFDLGFMYGRKITTKQINEIIFENYHEQTIKSLRESLGIDIDEIQLIQHLKLVDNTNPVWKFTNLLKTTLDSENL